MTDGALAGKVALVTGGSRGLGREMVLAFAGAGADVVITSRKIDACKEVAAQVEALGRGALPVACHVGHWDELDGLVEQAYGAFGRVDVLVNNAGMSPAYADLADVGEDLYDKVHAVNARGPFRLSVLIGQRMANVDGGAILNISSVSSWRPTTTDLPYAMAKAALNALTLGLAGAWAPKVRANVVLPSASETDLTSGFPPETKARIAGANPMKRLGRPEDVARVCVFLASDAAAYVNGTQVPVDGGLYRTL